MANLMKQITDRIKGWNTSGTNSKHDPEFSTFKRLFRKGLTKELYKIGATNIVFSYGHYYISGFFTMNTQAYYFSLSDVRHGFVFNRNGEAEIMYRTAKNYKDYTGGGNQWLLIEEDMFVNTYISTEVAIN